MSLEQLVGMASKLYQCRKTARFLHGEKYVERVEEYKAILANNMPRHGNDVLKTVIFLANEIKDKDGSEGATILLMAAAVEIIESK